MKKLDGQLHNGYTMGIAVLIDKHILCIVYFIALVTLLG